MKAIINGKILQGSVFQENKVLIYDDSIRQLVDGKTWKSDGVEVIDAKGGYVLPGFIDVHIHGYKGADVMDGKASSLATMSRHLVENGVTSYLATTMTMSQEAIQKALQVVASYQEEQTPDQGAQILGVHLEGPFINASKKGAQKEDYIQKANADLFAGYEDLIKLITIAPEIPGHLDFIQGYKDQFRFSIGHSAATYDQAVQAIKAGAKSMTHLFNAMTGLHHREPGIVGAGLTHDCYTELIADRIHVNPALYDLIIGSKGVERLILITDAMSGAGNPEGTYDLGGQEVTIERGRCLLSDGTLAGSVLKLNEGVSNLYKYSQASLGEVVQAATLTPATYLGVEDRKGSIEKGKDADLVIMDDDFNIIKTFVKGRNVYEN